MLDGFIEGQCVWGRVRLLLSLLWVPTLSSSAQCPWGRAWEQILLHFAHVLVRIECSYRKQMAQIPLLLLNTGELGLWLNSFSLESGAAYLVLLQVCELNWRLKWPHTASLCGCPSCQHGNQLWFFPTVWRFLCVLDAENMLSSSLKGLQASLAPSFPFVVLFPIIFCWECELLKLITQR